jgi:hypothetical protein
MTKRKATMLGVQKKMMMIRKKESINVFRKVQVNYEEISDNEQCAEEADGNHETRGDNGRCVQAADDNWEQKKQ